MHDAGLVVPGVAALTIDRAKRCLGVKMVHESAGTEIDGLATQERVVGIQYAVNKTQYLPVRDQSGKCVANAVQQL